MGIKKVFFSSEYVTNDSPHSEVQRSAVKCLQSLRLFAPGVFAQRALLRKLDFIKDVQSSSIFPDSLCYSNETSDVPVCQTSTYLRRDFGTLKFLPPAPPAVSFYLSL